MERHSADAVVASPVTPRNGRLQKDHEYLFLNDSEEYLSCHICNHLIVGSVNHAYDLGTNQAVCGRCADASDEEE